MKIVVYGPERRVGVWKDDRVIDVALAYRSYAQARGVNDEGLPSQLLAFIETGPVGIEGAYHAVEHASSGNVGEDVIFARNAVQLHAPWPGKRIACVGGNYGDHLHGMYLNNRPPSEVPPLERVVQDAREAGQWGFWKVPDEVVGPDGQMPYPGRTRFLDYEGEAAIVFGARGKNIPAASYKNYVWGVTLVQDGSLRDGGIQPRAMSYNLAKNFDGGTGVGPCIVVGELDPENVPIETRVNGQLRQQFNTKEMIFSWGEIIEYLSQDFTFVPGDILSGGTGAGTAADKTKREPDGTRSQELFLKRGDAVEVSSPEVGVLRISVV